MKEIQVSDEDYEFLKDCVSELRTQDNRSTRSPLYTIWKTTKKYGVDKDYTCDIEYVWDDSTFESLLDIFDYLDDNEYREELLELLNKLSEEHYADYNNETRTELEDYFTIGSYDEEIEDFLRDKFEIYSVGVTTEDVQVTDGACFSFFEKDAIEHLERTGHNLGVKAYTYADSLCRSPRMEKLLTMLHGLKLE